MLVLLFLAEMHKTAEREPSSFLWPEDDCACAAREFMVHNQIYGYFWLLDDGVSPSCSVIEEEGVVLSFI